MRPLINYFGNEHRNWEATLGEALDLSVPFLATLDRVTDELARKFATWANGHGLEFAESDPENPLLAECLSDENIPIPVRNALQFVDACLKSAPHNITAPRLFDLTGLRPSQALKLVKRQSSFSAIREFVTSKGHAFADQPVGDIPLDELCGRRCLYSLDQSIGRVLATYEKHFVNEFLKKRLPEDAQFADTPSPPLRYLVKLGRGLDGVGDRQTNHFETWLRKIGLSFYEPDAPGKLMSEALDEGLIELTPTLDRT